MRPSIPAIVSPAYDVGWFVAPGVAAAAIGLAIGLAGGPARPVSPMVWVVTVVLVDVAHVWASLYRTYLDPVARRIHRTRLVATPLLVLWVGFLVHLESPRAFWTLLAYVAIFHFVKQHVGFALLYARKAGESPRDRRIVEAAVWAGTMAPVVWWHSHLPREFAWFVEGDLVPGLPAVVGTIALALQVPVLAVFALRRLALARQGRRNPLLFALVLLPALNWHLGIVLFDDDRIFTITNVLLHGIPYLALVWLAGGRERVARSLGGARPWAIVAAVYYGVLVVLALVEETLWDRLVWHDRPELFGAADELAHPVLTAAVVAVLTVPQATHYVLDRWIWRVGPNNPELAGQLGFTGAARRDPP
ncbi:MAG TPA: hypothetical protein VFG69_15195 [Nannocystaceae bacterium]|nr:hypothetical protein [Nannocystaceae bacterium]